MATGPTRPISVALAPHYDAFVEAKVAAGQFQSAAAVIEEGLRLLEEIDLAAPNTLDDLRSHIEAGLQQARRGELLDGEQTFEELEAAEQTPVKVHQ